MTEETSKPPRPQATGDDLMPGDPPREEMLARMIRVDHAGEYGAARIYAGQLAVLERRPGPGRYGTMRGTPAVAAIQEMAEQEQRHLETFEKLMVDRRVRPTALSPIWHVAGYALGAATAMMGEKAAMACTVAVEEVIDEHYAAQADRLGEDEAALRDVIEEFRADEVAHRDTAIAHDAEAAPGYPLMSAAIKAGSRLAIWLSTRV